MLNFAGLKKGDKLAYYGEQKMLVVKSVDSDSSGWWMVEFENEGRNIKSGDPTHILSDFDLLCPKHEQPMDEECELCRKEEMVAKVGLLVGQNVVVHITPYNSNQAISLKVKGTLLRYDAPPAEWCVTTSIPSFNAAGNVNFGSANLFNVEGMSIFLQIF